SAKSALRSYAAALLIILGTLQGSALAQVRSATDRDRADKEKERQAQVSDYIKANYTKYEYQVPMRDGKKLFTSVYVPKDNSQTYPILFDRTPYAVAPYGPDNYRTNLGPSEQLMRSGYIFAYQDVRGRFMSEGDFVEVRPFNPNKKGTDIDESSDAYDTIDFLVKNVPRNNGKVGMWGISYPGFYTAMGMIDAHPALKAVSPQAPIADWFIGDDFHHNGALFMPHMLLFEAAFGLARPKPTTKWPERLDPGTPDGYNFFLGLEPLSNVNEKYFHRQVKFWDEFIQHPNYDEFWKSRSTLQHLKNIKPAVLIVGGWYDAEDLWGEIHSYEAANRQSPQGDVKFVMGPWCHGCWGRGEGEHLGYVWFGSKTSVFYRENIEFPFFEQYLKDRGDAKLPEAFVFETGSNEWKQYDAWPPKQAKQTSLYLHANGKLSFDPPAANEAFDEYVSDPAKPVPFYSETQIGMAQPYMVDDQRWAGRRTDVLVYQTDVLDRDVTLAGPLKPSLFVSTTGTDSDFVVKLIDVYPDDTTDTDDKNPAHVRLAAYQQLVRGEPFRGRFRNSFEKPEPFEPGKTTKVEFAMPDVNHTFRRGHRIMVQIQSTWFPLVDINPQKFVPNIYLAAPADFQKATQRVYHATNAASRINVTTLQP
ncbi:MAG TPA: CocE/NonD family hydrolase, partial [Clostridia bacterium]|nr:CocE/NonD family hydrolase [Clostridia bacterium]